MKINYLILLGFSVLCLLACGKDEINSISSSALVKTSTTVFSQGDPGFTQTYFYDNQNRVILKMGTHGDSTVFKYQDKLITEEQFDSLGTLTNTNLYYLNSIGLVDSSVTSYNNLKYKMKYDGSGYPLVKTYYNASGTSYSDYYTNSNGNITLIQSYDYVGIIYRSESYSYDLNSLNSIENKNTGQSYFGKFSVNIRTQVFATDKYGVSKNYYIHEFDSLGRISKIISKTGTLLAGTSTITYY